jgi:hypothetical protein
VQPNPRGSGVRDAEPAFEARRDDDVVAPEVVDRAVAQRPQRGVEPVAEDVQDGAYRRTARKSIRSGRRGLPQSRP